MEKKGIPFGALYGILIVGGYIYSYMGLGIMLVWNSITPTEFMGWLALLGSSIGYLVIGIIGLLPVLGLFIYFLLKDRDVSNTLKNTWPIIAAILYPMLPINIPGPIDDVIILGLAGILQTKMVIARKKLEYESGIYLESENQKYINR